ncbi:uncharacterized protein LOC131703227 [Acipenser ruthenus]|uniref:uncharacterized protein LOC131703227 n=1 Tax=Acipenser ruthenus TaxID=7906 RepID=UPI002742349C|nr:uncharacterized protein LOC131703227 [Acipenser ruthenus]
MEVIDRFEVHLSMKCLAIKLEMKKAILPGLALLQTRPETIAFMEQPAVDRIEMNLKHKQIEKQRGVVTMYKKSMALMIPKAPPLPPRMNHASMSDLPPRRDGNGMASQMMSAYREPCTSTALGKTAYPPERNAAKKGKDPDPRNKGQLPAQKRRAGVSRDSGGNLSPGEKKGATGGPHEPPCFSLQNLQSLRSISNSEWKDRLKWTSSRGS